MAILCMLYGQSGTGKSTSLRNFQKEDVSIINVSGKPMPFRRKLPIVSTDDYKKIIGGLRTIKTPSIVIDDATYLMVNAFMRNAKVQGYQKYTDMAYDFNSLIDAAQKLPDDKIVYFIGHSNQSDDGRAKVEEAKRKLSKKQSAKVRIDVNGSRTEIVIKRTDFEQMTSDIVAKTMNFVDATLEKVPAESIDTVLLVGGSTYMPMIINAVEAKFPGKVQQHDPDQAVAKGAAIYASMLVEEVGSLSGQGETSDSSDGKTFPHAEQLTGKFTVEDQTPRSFGPGVVDTKGAKHKYVLENFIKIGEKMPAVFSKTYYPLEDNQELVRLRAFENMSTDDTLIPCVDEDGNPQATDPAHNVKLLGELVVKLPPETSRDTPIKVTFKVDASGVHVEAVNTKTNETFETFLRTESDIDVEKSAVHQLRISSD